MRQRWRTSSERQPKLFCEALLVAVSGLLLGTTHACPGNLPFKPKKENMELWTTVLETPDTIYKYTKRHFTWDEAFHRCSAEDGFLFVPTQPARVYGDHIEHTLASNLKRFTFPGTSPAPWAGARFITNHSWITIYGDNVTDTMWAMKPVTAEENRFFKPHDRCAFFFVFPRQRTDPKGPGELFGLIDGSCSSRRSALCETFKMPEDFLRRTKNIEDKMQL